MNKTIHTWTSEEYPHQCIEKINLVFFRRRTCSCRQLSERAKIPSSSRPICSRQTKSSSTKKTCRKDFKKKRFLNQSVTNILDQDTSKVSKKAPQETSRMAWNLMIQACLLEIISTIWLPPLRQVSNRAFSPNPWCSLSKKQTSISTIAQLQRRLPPKGGTFPLACGAMIHQTEGA